MINLFECKYEMLVFLMLTALLLCCAALYCTIASFYYRVTRWKAISCAVILFLSYALFRTMADLSNYHYADTPIPQYSRFIAQSPLVVIISILVFFTTLLIYIIVRIHFWRHNHISSNSIKESCDSLPMGLCFCDENGLPLLKNKLIDFLSSELCGEELLDGIYFWSVVKQKATMTKDSTFIIAFPNDKVWSFERKTLTENKLYQITATDISTYYLLTKQLRFEINELRKINMHLQSYNDMVYDITKEKEILSAKEKIHDRMGRTLITTKIYIENNQLSQNNGKLIQLWKENTALLHYAEDGGEDEHYIQDVKNAAALVGITPRLIGTLPTENKRVMAILTAVLMEALNNAARHAKADTLTIECQTTETDFLFTVSNNGKPPQKTIIEGGGISTLRQKIARENGSLEIETTPQFALKIKISKNEVLYYDKCVDC
ncbi:MAG: sensor histidine kinase [Acutalibacteraceae bacterium]